MKKIDNDVIGVLSRLSYTEHDSGSVALIPGGLTEGRLDPKLYKKVNEVLVSFGGKWNRKVGGHIFAESPQDKIDGVVLSGEFIDSHAFDFFETPPDLARRMVAEAGIAAMKPLSRVLEPSAGRGAIADAIMLELPDHSKLYLCELRDDNRRVLEQKDYKVGACDFMGQTVEGASHPKVADRIDYRCFEQGFDAIVMNPPFSKQQDIDHVTHAYQMLRPGGKLVAIMSAGTKWRENKRAQAFRDRVEECGYWVDLLQGTFKASGTLVNTIMVVLKK